MLAPLLKKYPIEIFAVLAFLILLPLSWQINYLQNDEVTHFQSVQHFLQGNLTLHPYIITTFYSQGSLEALWLLFFGASHMAVLTLIVSIITVYFFTKIIKDFFSASNLISILLGTLFLVNPIFLYSALGNMTENYFMFYFVVSLYLFYRYRSDNKTKSFILSLVFATLGFLARQVGILISLGYGLYFLTQKRYKEAVVSIGVFIVTTTWYYTIFPRTPQMDRSSGASFINVNPEGVYSIVVVALSYLGVFFLPLVISLALSVKSFSKKQIILFSVFLLVSVLTLTQLFKPDSVLHTSVLADSRVLVQNNSVEFPYLWNTFGRTGFFPDNIAGTRYHYAGYFTLFKIYHYVGIASAIFLIAYVLSILSTTQRAKLFTPVFALLAVNIGITLILSKVYDRYLLPAFPVFILSVLSLRGVDFSKLEKIFMSSFVAFFIFMGYQYSMDFVLVNKFAWEKATSLVEQGVEPHKIKIGNAWGVMYPNVEREYSYHVAYQTKRGFEVLEKQKIEFPFSIYVDPYVYLVKQLPEN